MREETSYDVEQGTKQGPIQEMDRELERFDVQLERLEKILAPVMNRYGMDEKVSDSPVPEPATELRGFTQRWQGRLARLDRIMNDIDL